MLLELTDINKHFSVKRGLGGSRQSLVKAVDGVSLGIAEGESVSIVGESGSGKTTIARLIMKLMPLTAGSIVFDGKDITKLKTRKQLLSYRRNVQMVFQDPYSSLDPRFNVRSIIREGMYLDPVKDKNESDKEQRVFDLLKAVDLSADVLSRYPHEFSGGERQRIAIARALALKPKMLILDEAVSSLDVIVQKQILDLLVNLQKKFNLTYIFISHNLKVVRQISQRVAVMYKGRVVEYATTDQIYDNPKHVYTKDLLSAAIDYKAVDRDEDLILSPESQLQDVGDGHWVLGS